MPGLADLAKELGPSKMKPMMGKSKFAAAPEEPEMGDETEAAESFLAAIRSGDPEELVMAYKELKAACESGDSSYAPEEE